MPRHAARGLISRAALLATMATARATNIVSSGAAFKSDAVMEAEESVRFLHAPLSYFALELLTPKGPRKNVDVGDPHDFTRPLVKDLGGSTSVGSWACTEGAWDSPKPRGTTETFYVLEGAGALTDADGTRHDFGPGDTVILPKGWHGRWEVLERIHKVWVVHDHPEVEVSGIVRVLVTPLTSLAPEETIAPYVQGDPPTVDTRTLYSLGTTSVGCSICSSGCSPVAARTTTECFHLLDGVAYVTNADGSAQRAVAGDTVVLPKGWSGHWDVIEPVKKLWVELSD